MFMNGVTQKHTVGISCDIERWVSWGGVVQGQN